MRFWLAGTIIYYLIIINNLFANSLSKEQVSLISTTKITRPKILVKPAIEKMIKIKKDKIISVNVQDIEIKSILQLLAEFTGNNMIVSDTVTGHITLSLNAISWDHALDVILSTNFLEKKYMGNILYISSEKKIITSGKLLVNKANAIKTNTRSEIFKLNYTQAVDLARILQEKADMFISAQGKLFADARTNSLWVYENSQRLAIISSLIKQLDVPVQQVLIEARIVNVTKDFVRDLGLHFNLATTDIKPDTKSRVKLLSKTIAGTASLVKHLNFEIGGLNKITEPNVMGMRFAWLSNNILLDLELSALESEGRGEVISSPRLITTNQQPAIIEAGEEIPYQETTSSGATAVSFKKAVLSLKVTPHITQNATILMNLKINQDIPTLRVFNGVPTILTKEVQTTVLVNNGQTIVLGGIYKKNKDRQLNRIPFLRKLPIVGKLFNNSYTTIRNEELLIFITPRIVSSNLDSNSCRIKKNNKNCTRAC